MDLEVKLDRKKKKKPIDFIWYEIFLLLNEPFVYYIPIISIYSWTFKIILCQNFSKSKSFDYIDSKYALKTAKKYKPIYGHYSFVSTQDILNIISTASFNIKHPEYERMISWDKNNVGFIIHDVLSFTR